MGRFYDLILETPSLGEVDHDHRDFLVRPFQYAISFKRLILFDDDDLYNGHGTTSW